VAPSEVFQSHFIASAWWSANWGWLAACAVVLGGLAFGLRDVSRFSLKRTWAISGVCFDESIRRRVLWITPLAILGVIVVTQLQHADDEQDALRQTVKICLFATGLVTIMVSIILACTNLPKEIETRVIYTIVTKPTTRLEIIIGKVIGFSRVSLAVLLIMGTFTWGYLHIRERQKRADIALRLREGDVGDAERARLEHYMDAGMLTARTLHPPDELQVFGKMPDPNTSTRIINGNEAEDVLMQFVADRTQLFGQPPKDGGRDEWIQQGIAQTGMVIRIQITTKRTGPASDQPAAEPVMGPVLPGANKADKPLAPPEVVIELASPDGYYSFIGGGEMGGGTELTDLEQVIAGYGRQHRVPHGDTSSLVRFSEVHHFSDGTDGQTAYAWLPPKLASKLFDMSSFYVRIAGMSQNVDFEIGPSPARVFVPTIVNGQVNLMPTDNEVPALVDSNGKPAPLIFRGRLGIHGDQEIRGGEHGPEGVALVSFRDCPRPVVRDGVIPFELNLEVDRSNADVQEGMEDATTLDVGVHDLASGKSQTQTIKLESRQTTFFTVPADLITSGNFDLTIACLSSGHIAGLFPDQSLQIVIDRQGFEVNLIKSLSILWMMSILVLTLSVLCSTFLSWPIAVVLTVVLLMGHWCMDQLSDTAGPGLGHQIVNDFKFTDAPVAAVVSTGVDALTHAMNIFAQSLPDTGKFDAVSDIDQGVTISAQELLEATAVLAGFGLPAIVLAYLVLKNKEVAP
jgi:ABC-type transport system involved in multi-copper enzyme maturation permease subunit